MVPLRLFSTDKIPIAFVISLIPHRKLRIKYPAAMTSRNAYISSSMPARKRNAEKKQLLTQTPTHPDTHITPSDSLEFIPFCTSIGICIVFHT